MAERMIKHTNAHMNRNLVGRMTLALVACTALTACVERRVWIESTPPGALVWINDAQVGRTPVDVAITHEGVYDLRIEKDGYEPLITPATTDGPVWDQFPLDFFAQTMPFNARSETRWMFTLTVRDDSESALVQRASSMRDRVASEGAVVGDEAAVTPDANGLGASSKSVDDPVEDHAETIATPRIQTPAPAPTTSG